LVTKEEKQLICKMSDEELITSIEQVEGKENTYYAFGQVVKAESKEAVLAKIRKKCSCSCSSLEL
jgi:hypothetical protein